jgi:hypothetical protein
MTEPFPYSNYIIIIIIITVNDALQMGVPVDASYLYLKCVDEDAELVGLAEGNDLD